VAAQSLDLSHQTGTTRVWIGPGALAQAAAEVSPWLGRRKVFVVSSAPVRKLHRRSIDSLLDAAADVVELEVPDGESAKSFATVERLTREMVIAGGKRDSRLVILGGGTVGDVGGFTAGCFLRGIDYAQIPTTLLAQVDAAIGGKTAVNLPEAKNAVGLFVQPRWVISDDRFLRTLPPEAIRQALFEIVKTAILGDRALFELVESSLEKLLAGDPEVLAQAVQRTAAVKIGIVAADEREGDRRRLLNLGHTLGHALETVVGHGELAHGDAVGYGLLFATVLGERNQLAGPDAERIRRLLGRMGLPRLAGLEARALSEVMARDKKARESGLAWVLPVAIGGAEVVELARGAVDHELASFLEGSVE
jgi:3-dehydroquinate synthase